MRYVNASRGKHSSSTGAGAVLVDSWLLPLLPLLPSGQAGVEPQRQGLCRFNVSIVLTSPTQLALSLCGPG